MQKTENLFERKFAMWLIDARGLDEDGWFFGFESVKILEQRSGFGSDRSDKPADYLILAKNWQKGLEKGLIGMPNRINCLYNLEVEHLLSHQAPSAMPGSKSLTEILFQ